MQRPGVDRGRHQSGAGSPLVNLAWAPHRLCTAQRIVASAARREST